MPAVNEASEVLAPEFSEFTCCKVAKCSHSQMNQSKCILGDYLLQTNERMLYVNKKFEKCDMKSVNSEKPSNILRPKKACDLKI